MNKIRVMNELLSNKIAAGEVVEKVVSIVKELVENSVDAKATNIKIDLKEAGIREIIVTDNGIKNMWWRSRNNGSYQRR